MIYIEGLTKDKYFRNYDPETGKIIFRGETYDLVPVIKEVAELYLKVGKLDIG